MRARTDERIGWLSHLGYRHYIFPYTDWGGPLIPLIGDNLLTNIFSFGPAVEKRDHCPQAFATRAWFNPTFRPAHTPERVAEVAQMCIAARSSDGIHWADPDRTEPYAAERAAAAASLISGGSRVLDLGAGSMLLAKALPSGCKYQPADLIARSEDCVALDLNQGQFPAGDFDVVTLLEVLEYLHDVPALLRRCRAASRELILTYHRHDGGMLSARRQRGFLSDLSSADLAAALASAGWQIQARATVGDAQLWRCIAAD